MAAYNLKSALAKIGRVVGSGRGANYFARAKQLFQGGKGLFSDLKHDYSNPAMGRKKRKGKKRSTPKMGRKKRKY